MYSKTVKLIKFLWLILESKLGALNEFLVKPTLKRIFRQTKFSENYNSLWQASKTQGWRQSVCWMSALGARWPHWVNERVDLSRKMCEAHVCWLSVHDCLPPAVCLWLSAVPWIVVARKLRKKWGSAQLVTASSVSVSNCWWCCQSFNVVFSAPSSSAENRKQNQQRWLQQLQLQHFFIIYYTY